MTTILAIDPGLTGALAIYRDEYPSGIIIADMPVVDGEINVHQLNLMLREDPIDIAYIERVGPMPRDGVRQAWRFSAAYTAARTVVSLIGIPTRLVAPTTWKKAMNMAGGPVGKEQCRGLAIELFPSCASAFARKKDQGRAEAALLAVYASRSLP